MLPSTHVKETVLRELLRTVGGAQAEIQGSQQGFKVRVRLGEQERTLETARGGIRLFASLDTAASFVQELGLQRFVVDMTAYQPGRLRKARPDRSAALKQTRTRMKQESFGI